MIQKLGDTLFSELKTATEVYIATALITYPILKKAEEAMPDTCRRKYLIGVDLATPTLVLEKLKELSNKEHVDAKIYKETSTYHPKLYMIKQHEKLVAFMGSANATDSGFYYNTELSIQINDQSEFYKLLTWFNEHYNKAHLITKEFIDEYRGIYKSVRKRESSNRSDINSLFNLSTNESVSKSPVSNAQFFKEHHYEAYTETYHSDYSEAANSKRRTVKERMKDLHRIIYPSFEEFGLDELYAHWHKPNITSSEVYRKGFNQKLQDAMWLHYGYSKERANKRSFMELPRIQVILVRHDIGVWFVIGKDYGSKQLRENLKNELKSSISYRKYFHQLLEDLGGSYRLFVGGVDNKISALRSPDHTYDLMMTDNQKHYLILARDFDKNDPALSENQIGDTILDEFKRLYPIYEEILRFS